MKRGKGKNGLLPNSLRIISSCLKTVSSNAGSVASTVRSAGVSVAASFAAPAEEEKDQVLWAGFDKLEFGSSSFKHVLLLGYSNGFQVLDVEDASNVCELVSKHDGPVTFLQMQPIPAKSGGIEGFRASHPLLLVVAGDETNGSGMVQGGRLSALIRESTSDPQSGNPVSTPTVVRFYSLKSHNYVHVLRFRSAVYLVRCSPRIVAVALAAQIYCFDAVTLENKFSVLTYPLQGAAGVNIGYGPMAIGPRWLAYSSNNPLLSNTGRLSPQNLTPSPGVSPSTSPSSGSLVARYAMESSKQLAAGILNLGDMGYKTLSKYCQELLPDGSNSPLSSNSRRIGRLPSPLHHSEADNAGMVVIKDFMTKEVISQFRAHNSPISALCFDPSGTLLVTASVHGNNINVFRIMPTCIPNGSSSGHYDWTSSHVHLYKLHRGVTTAGIQDISFGHYSQWIAIISSKGTCHIYVLSPFGGDVSLQPQNPHSDGLILTPNLTLPWWSTTSCIADQQFHPPPPLPPSVITLYAVSRIKDNNYGWLNTVSNVAASAAGKISVPSGAIAAVFHNSIFHDSLPISPKANSLEHLLVYSPSGHVIQHELLPSTGAESSDSSSRIGSGPLLQRQDEELRVIAEPVQWWDVCRRSSWPEREETIPRIGFRNRQNAETIMDTSDCEDNETSCSMSSDNSIAGKESVKSHGRSHWYLSNAEVQISSGTIPIWQKPKMCFYLMDPSRANGRSFKDGTDGEIEIEKLALHEVEMRRKDLLPVFEQFHSSQSVWSDRGLAGGRCKTLLSETDPAIDKFTKDTIINHSMPSSLASGLDVGTTENLLDLDRRYMEEPCEPVSLQTLEKAIPHAPVQNSTLMVHCGLEGESVSSQMNSSAIIPRKLVDKDCASYNSRHSNNCFLMDGSVINGLSATASGLSCAGMPVIADTHSSNGTLTNEISNACIGNIQSEQTESSDSHNSLEFTQYFHEGYCKVSELDDCRELTEAVTDADSSSSHCEREKPEEDGDNDEMLGGVFTFSEEGRYWMEEDT